MSDERKLGGRAGGILLGLTALKYAASILLLGAGAAVTSNADYLWAGLLELLAIFLFTNFLANKSVVLGGVVNSVLLLVFNLQAIMLVFAASYVTPLMISNLFNIEDLSGQAQVYISGAVLTIVASLLPIAPISIPALDKPAYGIGFAALIELVAMLGVGISATPVASAIDLKGKWDQYNAFLQQSAVAVSESGEGAISPEMIQAYYREVIPGGRDKPAELASQPNIIIIFTEGLSQSIIDDERNIMPNVARYQQESLSFTNYYNHTAATFRGLNGQLYSGFQLDDLDANSLVSLQSILADQGYHTTLINTEPFFPEWTDFLEHMGFQTMVNESVTGEYALEGNRMSDYETYQTLISTVEEEAAADSPFLVCVYTFGTHVSYDSPNQVFGDGGDAELNKFYNCDYQFGQFMEWFEGSDVSQDTIVVFTADHATYRDVAFLGAFPSYERTHYFCDTIPCFYYYEGVVPEQIDVGGRNTLDFTPTLLDYLDVSEPNCFLGESLFINPDPVEGPEGDYVPFDMVYFDGIGVSTTQDSEIIILGEDSIGPYMDEIMEYVEVSRIPQ